MSSILKRALAAILSASACGITPMSAHACTAATSTLSQEANLFSSDHTRDMSGRVYLGITRQFTTAQRLYRGALMLRRALVRRRGTTPTLSQVEGYLNLAALRLGEGKHD